MPIGVPVPSNLAEMGLEDLLALHSSYASEHAEVIAKRAALIPMIQAKTQQKNAATRAGFDLVIGQGAAPLNTSPDMAKELLDLAGKGALTLGKTVVDRLKQIAGVK
jgi:hypothetical protein